ncbi:Uncharacterised protein [Salmonella enterica subsp. arizonae]|uniref:Uncharacterized protein n=1 Tax=Salmonella enterica subsp. arizonae TaxID=59203 RepID=A0A3S4GUP4_SALER|nr:Uncharacterised protein [Salmonella enterica subsp. arizonae]
MPVTFIGLEVRKAKQQCHGETYRPCRANQKGAQETNSFFVMSQKPGDQK